MTQFRISSVVEEKVFTEKLGRLVETGSRDQGMNWHALLLDGFE
jgi:hypothetical protein